MASQPDRRRIASSPAVQASPGRALGRGEEQHRAAIPRRRPPGCQPAGVDPDLHEPLEHPVIQCQAATGRTPEVSEGLQELAGGADLGRRFLAERG